MCEHCNIKDDNGKSKRGKSMTGLMTINVYIWGAKTLEIETDQDDVFASVPIKFCPMCGREL